MRPASPSLEQIERLLTFRAAVSTNAGKGVKDRAEQNADADTPSVFHYPAMFEAFFSEASAECWSDSQYDPWVVGPQLEQDGFIESADLEQIRSLLTYCVRGERFCDGFWAKMIDEGYIERILARLAELRKAMV
ncbi:MAG: DUF6508 domain-containing protein [Wenzhouxiangella sp.]